MLPVPLPSKSSILILMVSINQSVNQTNKETGITGNSFGSQSQITEEKGIGFLSYFPIKNCQDCGTVLKIFNFANKEMRNTASLQEFLNAYN